MIPLCHCVASELCGAEGLPYCSLLFEYSLLLNVHRHKLQGACVPPNNFIGGQCPPNNWLTGDSFSLTLVALFAFLSSQEFAQPHIRSCISPRVCSQAV